MTDTGSHVTLPHTYDAQYAYVRYSLSILLAIYTDIEGKVKSLE